MIETAVALKKMEEQVEWYERELVKYDMEQLLRKPGEEEWSLGQMYMHLIGSALHMQLANAEACREGGSGVPAGEKPEDVKKLFAMGGFPPIAIRVPPSPQYTPGQPESKEQIAAGLRRVLQKMCELEPAIEAFPEEHTKPHPRFGPMNAKEWFALVEMHFRHHRLQKARLDDFLQAGAEDYVQVGAGFVTRKPRIASAETMVLAGVECRTTLRTEAANGTIAAAWTELHRRMGDIRGRNQLAVTFGLKEYPPEEFTPDTPYTYLAAVVTDGSEQSEGIAIRHLEASSYAIFTYRGPVAGFGEAFPYIYSKGLPQAGLEPAAAFDMERYDERYTGADRADSETDIYVPIRK